MTRPTRPQQPPEGYLQIGKLGKTFQLKGGLRYYGIGEAETDAILSLETIFIPALGERKLLQVREMANGVIVYLEGITTVEAAQGIVNQEVWVDPETLPKLEEGEFYLEEIIGMAVFLDGEPFGEIIDLLSAGDQDLLVIEFEEQEHLVPFGADYVTVAEDGLHIDNPPEGLFKLHRSE